MKFPLIVNVCDAASSPEFHRTHSDGEPLTRDVAEAPRGLGPRGGKKGPVARRP